jgi:DoxX-like family
MRNWHAKSLYNEWDQKMSANMQQAGTSKAMIWTGRVLSALVVPPLVMGAIMSILLPPDIEKNFQAMGWPTSAALVVAVLNLGSLALYLIPQTAVLGAILLSGYLGGAVATHLRIGETGKCWIPVAFGIVVWLGLYLRDARLRALVPLRKL